MNQYARTQPFPRFLRRIGDPDANGCWPWLGQTLPKGYGLFWDGKHKTCAHRWIYEAHYGKATAGLVVMHKCDNPNCVNPNHMRLGTYRENTHDMLAKGRGRWKNGKDAGRAGRALTVSDVRAMRYSYRLGLGTQQELAKFFGVCPNTVYQVVHRITWPDLPDEEARALELAAS